MGRMVKREQLLSEKEKCIIVSSFWLQSWMMLSRDFIYRAIQAENLWSNPVLESWPLEQYRISFSTLPAFFLNSFIIFQSFEVQSCKGMHKRSEWTMKNGKSGQLTGVVTTAATSMHEHLEEEDNEGHWCHSEKPSQGENKMVGSPSIWGEEVNTEATCPSLIWSPASSLAKWVPAVSPVARRVCWWQISPCCPCLCVTTMFQIASIDTQLFHSTNPLQESMSTSLVSFAHAGTCLAPSNWNKPEKLCSKVWGRCLHLDTNIASCKYPTERMESWRSLSHSNRQNVVSPAISSPHYRQKVANIDCLCDNHCAETQGSTWRL